MYMAELQLRNCVIRYDDVHVRVECLTVSYPVVRITVYTDQECNIVQHYRIESGAMLEMLQTRRAEVDDAFYVTPI